jgi:hypothetical protein
MFKYTKKRNGYFFVHLDGVLQSQLGGSEDPVEAVEKAQRVLMANPTSRVHVSHDYELLVEFEEAPSFVNANVGEILNLKLVASDPSAVSISGLSVTPLKAADVELSVEVA